jgi:type II restriction/modification system DNA methylase subunit YeeA
MAKNTQLGYKEIEQRLQSPLFSWNEKENVGYNLLYAFGKSAKDIERYQEGKGVLKTFDGLLIKGLFCYRSTSSINLTNELERLKKDVQVLKAAPKIVAVSDGDTVLAFDLREKETFENHTSRLYCDFAFFYPLGGVERVRYEEESAADVKAAEKLAKLHDELRAYNEFSTDSDLHDLNIFISRLLFCFFAEDTGIFEENLFTDSIRRFTKPDGSDLSQYLDETFNVMDISVRQSSIPSIVKQFPYVNGGLFSKHIQIPKMGQKARRLIIECGELNWKDINPDIFGSMIQAVVNPEERASQGMHYTSVPNIMKVINPLFMDELYERYNKLVENFDELHRMKEVGVCTEKQFYDNCKPLLKKCDDLLRRMSKMKFFDPACGSGNFLIITYKSLRFLEMKILALKQKCQPHGMIMFIDASIISLNQFYGIELLDFPHEVAMLSLWLAEHQMNRKLNEDFGVNTKALPLKNITQIVCGNACRLDWNRVCPHTPDEEVFIFGNPPYLGSRNQNAEQKQDMNVAFGNIQHGVLDYICSWFYMAAKYCQSNINTSYAFVSTNSITQGSQISVMWEPIYALNLDILFAYTTFPWSNNAKYNAGVSCVIIGVGSKNIKKQKVIYEDENLCFVDRISPTIINNQSTFIKPQTKSISGLKPILKGSLPADDNNLTLYELDKDLILSEYPYANKFIKNFVGAQELIDGDRRYCVWVKEDNYKEAYSIPQFAKRFELVKQMRLSSKKEVTRRLASIPFKFAEDRYRNDEALLIPVVSSERREYIPMGFVPQGTVVYYSAFAIYNATALDFGIVSSKIHILWAKATSGKLESRIRYSAQLCYNTFPFPKISADKKKEIEEAAENVLITREYYPEKTLAELYDPDKMPKDLLDAHKTLDDIVESCYPGYPFASDEARLECLFKLYEKMTSKKK